MSVAPALVPDVVIPERARRHAPERLATVTVLCPPADPAPGRAAVRLTRRGVVVLTLAIAALGAGLVWLAAASAPSAPAPAAAPHAVTVQPGDTLWSIATAVAPGRDPLAEVSALQRRNHLAGVDLVPGQVLQVP